MLVSTVAICYNSSITTYTAYCWLVKAPTLLTHQERVKLNPPVKWCNYTSSSCSNILGMPSLTVKRRSDSGQIRKPSSTCTSNNK